jgi:UPF0716 protein FxsA
MGLLLVLLFIVVPIAELYVIIQVGELIGVVPTLLLLLLDAFLGSWLLKHEGRSAWRRFNQALAERRMPGKEVADGFLVILGGALLIAPGFITDVIGAILLIPPTRAVVRLLIVRHYSGRVIGYMTRTTPRQGRGTRPPDVEGTAVDVDAGELPR